MCALALEGYVRHAALSANQIVTLPGFGDYAIHKIMTMDSFGAVEIFPDPSLQESLVRENTFVPEEEMPPVDAPFTDAVQSAVRHVPKGTSDYQAAWIPDPGSITDTDTSQDHQADAASEPDIDTFRDAQSQGNGAFPSTSAF